MPARNGLRGARRVIPVAVIAVLASIIGGLTYLALPGGQPNDDAALPHDVVPSTSTMFDHQTTLLVVSDGYALTYPDTVADKMGWTLALDVQDGTGFLPGVDDVVPARVPFGERLDRDAATYHADYVLIDGGRNDLNEPPERVVAAADEYINRVHAKWPKAKVVVIAPNSATAEEPASYAAVAQGLHSTADTAGAYLIDPLAQRWYGDVDPTFLRLPDDTHLNANGDTYYADKIIENFKQMFDAKPTLLLVGDSFAGGTGDPGIVTYPNVLARKKNWNVALDAQGGTGFVHRVDNIAPPRVPFIDRLDADAATYHYRLDYVLIDGGRSDLGEPLAPMLAAADEYIKKVRLDWPNAKIVVVLPSYVTKNVASDYPALADGLRASAQSVGADVIDPVAQHWYRDIDLKPLLWKDGVNLSADGNAYYADKIIENLTRMGVAS